MTYSVVLYFNRAAGSFSVTARKTEGARLAEVDAQQGVPGVSRIPVLTGITEAEAKHQKSIIESTLEAMGFARVSRQEL
jgi:hypothetical protein